MQYIENTLTVIGAISAGWFVIKLIMALCRPSKQWQGGIVIKVDDYDPSFYYGEEFPYSDEAVYPIVYWGADKTSPYLTVTYLIPQGSSLYNVKVKRIVLEGEWTGKEKYETVQKYDEISPEQPLCVIAETPGILPQYVLEWKAQYGAKAKYYIASNFRDGRYNRSGIKYHYGKLAKIRRFLDV